MLKLEAKVSLKCFLGTFLLYLLFCMFTLHYELINLPVNAIFLILFCINLYFFLKFMYNDYAFQIAIRAAFLAILFTLGIYVKLTAPPHIQLFGTYMCVMAFFHYSEFLTIAIIQPRQVSTDSFMINHSPQYIIAAVTSWLEFFVEGYFYPGMKQLHWVSNFGLVVCIAGEFLRKIAMFTAGSNFNHLVQCDKSDDHVLVTHGIYAWFRHPSYVGWFYWSIGTQIILVNPACVVAYAIASWLFFKSRIFIEEITLLNFFGQQYCDYQQRVPTGIPFIEGYKI